MAFFISLGHSLVFCFELVALLKVLFYVYYNCVEIGEELLDKWQLVLTYLFCAAKLATSMNPLSNQALLTEHMVARLTDHCLNGHISAQATLEECFKQRSHFTGCKEHALGPHTIVSECLLFKVKLVKVVCRSHFNQFVPQVVALFLLFIDFV